MTFDEAYRRALDIHKSIPLPPPEYLRRFGFTMFWHGGSAERSMTKAEKGALLAIVGALQVLVGEQVEDDALRDVHDRLLGEALYALEKEA